MSDATTLIYHPDEKMSAFSKRIEAACTDNHVTEIQAAVVDGSLVLTLHVGVVQATQEDVDEEKEANGRCDFKVDEFIPEGDALLCKCMIIRAQTPEAAAKTEEYLDKYIHAVANGMVEDYKIVTGRGLVVAPHPEDLDKKPEQQRKVYIEREVSYAVVVFSAEALEDDPDEDKDIESKLRRPRTAESILNQT